MGYGLGILSIALCSLSYFLNDSMAGLAFFFAIPILLVSFSLLFGHASKGNGIFGSTTLYAIAFIVIAFSIWAGLNGNYQAWAGLAFGGAIIVVAKNRVQ